MVKKVKKVPKEPWFRKRRGVSKKGWGLIPVNGKGWVALVVLFILNIFAALYLDLNILEWRRWGKFAIVFLLSVLVFILIAKNKTLGVKDDI